MAAEPHFSRSDPGRGNAVHDAASAPMFRAGQSEQSSTTGHESVAAGGIFCNVAAIWPTSTRCLRQQGDQFVGPTQVPS
jgi:hypothetical protein